MEEGEEEKGGGRTGLDGNESSVERAEEDSFEGNVAGSIFRWGSVGVAPTDGRTDAISSDGVTDSPPGGGGLDSEDGGDEGEEKGRVNEGGAGGGEDG